MANDRQYGRQYGRERAEDPQEIGPPPDVVHPARRKKACDDLERFLKLYFPWAFSLKWSKDHLRVIEQIQRAVIDGGLFALAMPRGSGKTTIAERAALWAILTGRRKFVTLVGATEKHAEAILKSQMTELQYNDLLNEDFPEACYPIRKLENEARRCKGQKCKGQNTNIVWSATQLVLPTLPKDVSGPCNGGVISVCGITGAIRGQKHTTSKGEILRPSFILIDDPQTRESSESESQCANREAIIAGDVLGMAGPGQRISAVMPCTVIRRGDMADNLLNRQKHPDWNGERTKMLHSMPVNHGAIDEYAELRTRLLLAEEPLKAANTHWRKNRKLLEEGAEAAWPERKLPDEVSAIQHAVNLMLRDRPAFMAEYQNDPVEGDANSERLPTQEEICAKLSHVDRGCLSADWHHVTAFIDVQKEALFWCVCGWADNFSGGVLDYGCFPEQGLSYFSYGNSGDGLSAKLSTKYYGKPKEAAIFAGLEELTRNLCSRDWAKDGHEPLKIEKLLIDSGDETATVYQFCRWTPHAAIVLPTKGRGIAAGMKPLNEYRPEAGMGKPGLNWRPSNVNGKRLILIDTNFWKSFTFSRLATPRGAAGCLELYGREPSKHRLFASHLHAEFTVRTTGYGRSVTEWKQKPGRPDNHWFDCLVGCLVGASMVGCRELAGVVPLPTKKARVPLSQMGR